MKNWVKVIRDSVLDSCNIPKTVLRYSIDTEDTACGPERCHPSGSRSTYELAPSFPYASSKRAW